VLTLAHSLNCNYIFYVIKKNDLNAMKSDTIRHSYYKKPTSNQYKLHELWMTMFQTEVHNFSKNVGAILNKNNKIYVQFS